MKEVDAYRNREECCENVLKIKLKDGTKENEFIRESKTSEEKD